MNHMVYVQFGLLGRRFLDEPADPSYDGAGTRAIGNNFFESPPENLRIQITIAEQPEACASVIRYRGQRLVNFMGYGSCQFSHSCQPGNPSKLHLSGVQRLLRLLKIFLHSPLLRQIENESDTIVSAAFKECAAEQHGNSGAVFPEELFLEGSEDT